MKTCSKCKELKPLTEFSKDKGQLSGLRPSCRECNSAAFRKHYYENPEKHRSDTRKWAKENSSKKKKADAEYYQAHKEEIKKRVRQYHAEHSPARSLAAKKWNDENPEKRKAIYTKSVHKRRAVKAGADIGDLEVIAAWEKSWRSKRSVKCYWCRGSFSPKDCHQDHVIAISPKRGGSHTIGNLCISCSTCNVRKNAKTIAAWNESLAQPALL